MGGFLKNTVVRVVLLVHVVVMLAKILGGALKSIASTVGAFSIGKIPIGKPLGAVIGVLATPIGAIGKLFTVLLIVDVILLILFIIFKFIKKKKQNEAIEEVSVAESAVEKKDAFSKLMKVFK